MDIIFKAIVALFAAIGLFRLVGVCMLIKKKRLMMSRLAFLKKFSEFKDDTEIVQFVSKLILGQSKIIRSDRGAVRHLTDQSKAFRVAINGIVQVHDWMESLRKRLKGVSREELEFAQEVQALQTALVLVREKRGRLRDVKSIATSIASRASWPYEIRTSLMDAWDKVNPDHYLYSLEQELCRMRKELENDDH